MKKTADPQMPQENPIVSSEEVLVQNYSVGLHDWLDGNVTSSVSVKDAAKMLEQYAIEHEFPLPDARGFSLRSVLEDLVNWLRKRRLVADDGMQPASFRLFTFHIPPGGKGSISWSHSREKSVGITLKVFGAGWGGTAEIKLSKTVELSGCVVCHDIIQHMEVRIRRYVVEDTPAGLVEEVTVDPVRWLHQEPRKCKRCCGETIDKLDPFEFELLDSETVDARNISASLKIDRDLDLTFATNSTPKLELPGKALEAGLELKSKGILHCKTQWEFMPGTLYVPYVKLHDRGMLPKWGIH